MMWVEITNAKYLDGYKMFLVFNDGQKRIFDFLPPKESVLQLHLNTFMRMGL